MLKLIAKTRRLISITILAGTAFAFFSSNQFAAIKLAFNYWDPISITEYRLNRLTTDDFISEIDASLSDGDIQEAANLVALAQSRGHEIPTELVDKTGLPL